MNRTVKCFKCEKPIEPMFSENADSFECPGHGVVFDGGWNFGSRLYDVMLDGTSVRIVVCDDCLEKAKPNPLMLMEIAGKGHVENKPAKQG